MSKGNQLPDVVMSRTRIEQVDEFFSRAADPLNNIVTWNNNLDLMLQLFCSIGSDIKNANSKSPTPVIGVSELRLASEGLGIQVIVKKDGQEVTSKLLDRITREYFTLLETKAKLIHKRMCTLRRKPNLDHVKLKVDGNQVKLDIDKKWEAEYNDDEALLDLKRSLCKFNDRYALFCQQLKGPVTVHETVVALFEDVKKKLKELGSELGVTIEKDFMPKITGVPESIQDVLPSLPARGWKLFNELIDYIHMLQEQIPEMQEKLQTLANDAKDMQAKIKESASGAGLSLGDSYKAVKAFKKNTTTILESPKILTTLLRTIQETLLSIGGALTGKADSTPAPVPEPLSPTSAKKDPQAAQDSSDDDTAKDTSETTTLGDD